MATSALCGTGGVVTGTTSTEITKWSVDQTIDAQEATSMSSLGSRERIACLKGATGSFEALDSVTDLGSVTIALKTKTSGGYAISGTAFITKITITTPADGIVTYAHEFTFSGVITIA